LNLGRDNLNSDVSVGESNNETVLWCIVLVLCLTSQALSGLVVGLSFSTTTILDLVSAKVSAVLGLLDERHLDEGC
jgi:hypothetical protein